MYNLSFQGSYGRRELAVAIIIDVATIREPTPGRACMGVDVATIREQTQTTYPYVIS